MIPTIPNALTNLTSQSNLNKPGNGELRTDSLLGGNRENPFLPTQTDEPLIQLAFDEGK